MITFFDKLNQLPKDEKKSYQMDISHTITTKELLKKPEVKQQITTVYFETGMVSNMARLAKAALLLPDAVFGAMLKDMTLPYISENIEHLIYIVAAGIQNNHNEPTAELIDFVKTNFNHEQLLHGFNYTMDQMGMQSFINCLVIARGAEVIAGASKPLKDEY